ncbi:hypothetical protein CTEN210_12392 [Chaetoceros tenuissimus]|nr:hypothetical protein CTEN210_12392 [Chaetoceros tenuissimus]
MLLQDLQRSHMLCIISRSMRISSSLGTFDDEIWSIAYSAIPLEFICDGVDGVESDNFLRKGKHIIPSYSTLRKFCDWFFDYVNNVEQRRQHIHETNTATGATIGRSIRPRYSRWKSRKSKENETAVNTSYDLKDSIHLHARMVEILSYLSIHGENFASNDDEMKILPIEKLILFILMTRSMQWRVRLATSIDIMDKELTPDHPIFQTSAQSTFMSIAKSIEKTATKSSSKRRKRKREDNKVLSQAAKIEATTNFATFLGTSYDDFLWAEVLSFKSDTKSKASKKDVVRWTHIDPHFQLFDKPMRVEQIDISKNVLKETTRKGKVTHKHFSYVIGIEQYHNVYDDSMVHSTARVTDITPRYANKWSKTLKLRGATAKDIAAGKCQNRWWSRALKKINSSLVKQRETMGISNIYKDSSTRKERRKNTTSEGSPFKIEKKKSKNGKEVDVFVLDSDSDEGGKNKQRKNDASSSGEEEDFEDAEMKEFASTKEKEAIPTSKAAFKNHPLYVIPSVLKKQEVLAPDANKRLCGFFKGEKVLKRSDVSTALTAKKWLYEGRKVKDGELKNPTKTIKARRKPAKKGFQALTSYGTTTETQEANLAATSATEEDDGMDKLYGIWQTKRWKPHYVGPNDPIPVNDHKNVELALLNPGLAHIELYRIAKVAKQLGVPYAPCLLGFEGHGGNRTPTIRGIVVHEHNVGLLKEAHLEFQSQLVENEYNERQRAIYGKWKKLIVGVLTKDRIAREYAND